MPPVPVPRSLHGAVLLGFCLLGAGCSPGDPPRQTRGGGGELRVLLPSEPRELDPGSLRDELALQLAPNLYSRLVMLDVGGQLHPDLAESWTVDSTGLTYTFHLRSGVQWHDGRPFGAGDVRWTFEHLARKPSFAAEALRRIAGVETPDERTVVLHLREPWAPLLSTLAGYGTFILPRPAAGAPAAKPGDAPVVGTGPFRFGSWTRGREIVLLANRRYFRPGPFLDRVVYRFQSDPGRAPEMIATGEADYTMVRPLLSRLPALARDPRVTVRTSPTDSRYLLVFNLRRPPFSERRVREAVSRSLDRTAILRTALYGYGSPAVGFYTPAVAWAYNAAAQAPELDPDRARALFADAGLSPDSHGIRLRTELVFGDVPPFPEIARAVADQLQAVGIEVRLTPVTIAGWMERALGQHDFDLTLIGGSQGPDPENLNVRFGSHGTTQVMGYESPELDAALAEGSRTTDLARRVRAYYRAQEILARDLPAVPLAEAVHVTLSRRGVTGLPWVEGRGLVPDQELSLVRVGRRGGGS
jgi:peptide/nickel transport system substrate-binding protein